MIILDHSAQVGRTSSRRASHAVVSDEDFEVNFALVFFAVSFDVDEVDRSTHDLNERRQGQLTVSLRSTMDQNRKKNTD